MVPPSFTNNLHYLPLISTSFRKRYCRCCNECLSRRSLLTHSFRYEAQRSFSIRFIYFLSTLGSSLKKLPYLLFLIYAIIFIKIYCRFFFINCQYLSKSPSTTKENFHYHRGLYPLRKA